MKKAILAIAIIFLSISSCKKAENPVSANWELSGKIVYTVGYFYVYVLDLNLPTLKPGYLVFGTDARASADGKAVAFALISPSGSEDIYRIEMDGSRMRDLTNRSGITEASPDWSPDGEKIVFHGYTGHSTQLYTMNADGSNIRALTDTSQVAWYPRWSPDGRWIAFLRCATLSPHEPVSLEVISADGSRQVRLDEEVPMVNNVRWSSSAKKVAYWGSDGLRCVDLRTMRISRLTGVDTLFSLLYACYYDWASGDKLVCGGRSLSDSSHSYDVYLIDPDNLGSPVRIAGGFSDLQSLVPSPDGRYVAIFGRRTGDEGLYAYVVRADGADLQKIAKIALVDTAQAYVYDAQWVR